MAENNSDRNGRALEYAVSIELSKISNATLTERAIIDNTRDKHKFFAIPQELQQKYLTAAKKISHWVGSQFLNQIITIDRLPDSNTSVADIAVFSKINKIEISLKHNHFALKHPRPYSFAQACGYDRNTINDIFHRKLMDAVDRKFRALAVGKLNYNQCELSALYTDVYSACETSINSWISDGSLAKQLFGFLVNNGFYKIIVETGSGVSVKVQDYLSLASVNSITASTQSQYLTLTFSNGWKITLRVHTAATKISRAPNQLSLKFDAQKVAGEITEFIL